MSADELTRISRFLSLVLRHQPSAAGVTLDENGWVDISTLLGGCQKAGRPITRARLLDVVATNDKRRFILDSERDRIRAAQGHSVDVDLGLSPSEPSSVLYHGTVAAALAVIEREGLRPMRRRHVHLSSDVAAARRVGGRRGSPVVLRVDTASAPGPFFVSENGVWLTPSVPPEALSRFEAL